MNKYLKAIGFKKYNTKEKLNKLSIYVKEKYNRKDSYQINNEEVLVTYEKDFGEAIGIVVGEIRNNNGYSEFDFIFPSVRGINCLYQDNIEFEKITSRYEYEGICDENNFGIPLIFHVINIIEYLNLKNKICNDSFNSITLSGISSKGMVILPIERDEYQIKKEKKGNEIRNQMITAAKAGDIEAMEQLTLDDMDTYTLVSNRSKKEDIFTIVNSYFMPYTVECDKYSILGDILDVSNIKNNYTGEEMFYISLECNSIQIDFVIAKSDIIGVPEKGRRFKGNIWLQGEVDSI